MPRAYLKGELFEERRERLRRQKALMRAKANPRTGVVTVNCPYCLIFWQLENPVDVTRFVETEGKREHTTYCSKGHRLHFRTIDEWREERQKVGIQHVL